MTTTAIYELEPIGVDGALEATAAHFYCCHGHAEADLEQGAYDGMAVSAPEANADYPDDTQCERCGDMLPEKCECTMAATGRCECVDGPAVIFG